MDTILFKICIFLLASVVVVPIAKILKLGTVLGYLIAGVLIGPYVVGYVGVGDEASLRDVAEFGVVMMLFLIGLELKPSFLWKLRIPILGMGGAQMVLCTLAIAGIAWGFGQSWQAALALGMILSLSSTAIIVQTLSEKNLLGTKAGRSSFSVLLFQDISVIPILAILPLLVSFQIVDTHSSHGTVLNQWLITQPGYIRMLAILLAVSLVIGLGHILSSRLFRMIAAFEIREIFTAAALFIVVGVALLMESVGLSAALGTFLAGVMLADSEYRHEIELSIEPFKGLLLGLFFISVGASINFNLFMHRPWLVVAMVAGLVLVKFIVMYGIARLFRHDRSQALLFACVMAQGGEFAFVLFSFAAENYILPQRLTDSLTLAVTISMLITPFMMIGFDLYNKRYGRKINIQQPPSSDFNKINPVIFAGYGRFNQIIGRLLLANGYGCTILDNNPKVIDTLKRFGQEVYYGDATRPDLLELAGAAKAKIIVIGLKDQEKIDTLIEICHRHFPHLKILARAVDRIHSYRLIEHKVDYFQRELLDSSLDVGVHALTTLGQHPYTAHRQARIFKENDEKMLFELYQAWKADPHLEPGQLPGEQYISKIRTLSDQLSAVLRQDKYSASLSVGDNHAWEPAPTELEIIQKTLVEEQKAEAERTVVEDAVAAAQEIHVAESIEKATAAAQVEHEENSKTLDMANELNSNHENSSTEPKKHKH